MTCVQSYQTYFWITIWTEKLLNRVVIITFLTRLHGLIYDKFFRFFTFFQAYIIWNARLNSMRYFTTNNTYLHHFLASRGRINLFVISENIIELSYDSKLDFVFESSLSTVLSYFFSVSCPQWTLAQIICFTQSKTVQPLLCLSIVLCIRIFRNFLRLLLSSILS